MTKKKKITLIAGFSVLILAVSGFGFVMITGAFGYDSSHGYPFHRRGIPPVMQKEISEFILWRVDKGAKELDLSQVQQQQYDKFRNLLQETVEKGFQTRMALREKGMLEMEKPVPDLSIMALEIKTHVETMASSISEGLKRFADFYNSLDTDQKAKISRQIKERIQAHRNFHGDEKEI